MRAFEVYIRTGRIVPNPEKLEHKFNPWHDPDDGRFTFAGQGRRFGGEFAGGDRGNGGGTGSSRTSRFWRFDPKNPANHSIYSTRRGDTLSSIASKRRGLTARDLAWLNDIHASETLKVDQKIKLPHQSYLDAGRAARNNFLALSDYIGVHGNLPPNPAHAPAPSLTQHTEGLAIEKNGYRFKMDSAIRTNGIAGEIRIKAHPRSRSAQANAGKPDRLSSDDGGHYIAARFNGPREWFNHFAQDANFNRGAYRVLENRWAKAVRKGKRVLVDITPMYRGSSKRPYKLIVRWVVDGEARVAAFSNERLSK